MKYRSFIVPVLCSIYLNACSFSQQQPSTSEKELGTSNTVKSPKTPTTPSATVANTEEHVQADLAELPMPITEQIQHEAKTQSIRIKKEAEHVQARAVDQPKPQSFAGVTVSQAASMVNLRAPSEALDRENYQHFDNNVIKITSTEPLSTFSIDVDTASYSNVRRLINQGALPPTDAVRVEEFINYFSYDYPAPDNAETPFSVITEVGPSPWSEDRYLLHIGLQGYKVPEHQRPPVNLVFLIDVSGSMQSNDKLPLLKKSLAFMTNQLRAEDHVAIVVYAGASGLILPPTSGADKSTILNALEQLQAGGSTNGAAGIKLAYQTALQHFDKKHSNLILLATDGDFNVGTTNFNQLLDLIREKRKTGIAISTLGFGSGNYNDHLAEQIADAGNGTASYIDSLQEARKVLVEKIGSALVPIAKDTKVQIEFNPDLISEYRLIGYENRHLENYEFNMDSVDAGDLFSGHSVTAIYEIALHGQSKASIDPLRYSEKTNAKTNSNELAFLKLRYKPIGREKSTLISQAILRENIKPSFSQTSSNFQFSASVAAYAQLLRNSPFVKGINMQRVIEMAKAGKGEDNNGDRSAFINQVLLTAELRGENTNISLNE